MRALLLAFGLVQVLFVRAQQTLVKEVAGRDLVVRVRHWDERNGLTDRGVYNIWKDHQGFLWLSTESGLVRFDGSRFVQYGRPEGLHMDAVSMAVTDASGLLWAFEIRTDGTFGHVDLLDPLSGTIRAFQEVFSDELDVPVEQLSSIHRDEADSSLVMLDAKGKRLVRYHPRTRFQFSPWPDGLSFLNCLHGHRSLAQQILPSGIRIVVVDAHGRIEPSPVKEFPPGCTPWLLADENPFDGSLPMLHCAEVWYSFILRFDASGQVQELFGGKPLLYSDLNPVANLGDGLYWTGTQLRDGNNTILVDLAKDNSALLARRGSFRDGPDRIWIGTGLGLIQITVQPKLFDRYLSTTDDPITNGVRCRQMLVQGKELHVNAENRGHFVLDRETGDTLFTPSRGSAYAIAMDSRGVLHSSNEGNIVVYAPEGEQVVPIGMEIWALLPDEDGQGGFAGAGNFLVRYSLKDKRFHSIVEGSYTTLPGAHVIQLSRSATGSIWAATTMGAYRLSPEGKPIERYSTESDETHRIPAERVYHIREGKDGKLWFSTAGAGLLCVQPGQGVVQRYDRSMGMASNTVYASYQDEQGSIWAPTDRGLCRITPSIDRVTVFTTADGLSYDEFNRTSHAQAPDGSLYFGGLNGVTALKPDRVAGDLDTKPAPLVISSFSKLAGREREVRDLRLEFQEDGLVRIGPEDGQVDIAVSLLNYEPRELVVYEWKFEDEGTDWLPMSEPALRFGRLPYGEKVLLIRARSGRSSKQSQELRIPLRMLRPVYLQWWALAGMVLLTVGAVALLFRVRVARVRREYALRDRIAMDLHDEVGSTLSGINLTATVTRKQLNKDTTRAAQLLDEITESTTTTMDAMHDIVWAINARYDDLDSVVSRMRHYAGRMCEVKGIQLRFHADEHLDKVKLSMVQRRNTYLIFKEALNNSLKYAQCTQVEVDLIVGREVRLTVKDNGKGFILEQDTGESGGGGNGLRNMRKRAQELHGQLEVVSAPRQGTCITLRFSR